MTPARRRPLPLALIASLAVLSLSACAPLVIGGVGATAAVIAVDRRTTGDFVEDEAIEWRVRSEIKSAAGERSSVGVTSFNALVLLTGTVPDEATRAAVVAKASHTRNVRKVVDQLRIGEPVGASTIANDSLITSNVRARLLKQGAPKEYLVKVVTENSVTYLMGMVTQREADAAVEVARTTKGVAKVVTVFEYLTDEQAKKMGLQRVKTTSSAPQQSGSVPGGYPNN